MNLTFHGTFGLNFKEIRALIEAILKEPGADNFRISELTGIGIGKTAGKGKVQPTINWAKFGGLLMAEEKKTFRELKLSEEGELVYKCDPYFNSSVTPWFFHYHLSHPTVGEDKNAWNYFTHKFLPSHYEFTRDDLIEGLKNEFPDTKVDSINPGVILGSYLKENSMKSINLIQEIKKNYYRKIVSNISNTFIVGYVLAKIWEREHSESVTIPLDVIREKNHLTNTMNISEEDAMKYLDTLKNLGIIDLMRSVKPFQIVKQWTKPGEILKKAYEEL